MLAAKSSNLPLADCGISYSHHLELPFHTREFTELGHGSASLSALLHVAAEVPDLTLRAIAKGVAITHFDGMMGGRGDRTAHIGVRCQAINSYTGTKIRGEMPESVYGLAMCSSLQDRSPEIDLPADYLSAAARIFVNHAVLFIQTASELCLSVDVTSRKFLSPEVDAVVISASSRDHLALKLSAYYGGARWSFLCDPAP